MYRSNQHFSIICKNNYSVANQPTKRSVLLAKPVIRFFNASGGNIIINNEIPKTIPVADYAGYIMKNFKPDVIKFKKPESEWTEEEHTEYTKWSLKLSMAHRFKQQIQENKPLTNRDKRIIERFRSGADFFGEKYVAKKHQDYSNNHILLIYLMSGRKSTLKNTRKTKIKQSKSYLTYGFLNRSYIITKK